MQRQKSKTPKGALVPAVNQAAQILICLTKSQARKMKLVDICNQVGIYKSRGYSILNTLIHFGFVKKDSITKAYSLGAGLIFLSDRALESIDYREDMAPFLELLAKETNSAAFFGLIVGEHVFVVAKHELAHSIGARLQLGYRFPITYGSVGKAIVAFLPTVEREKILAEQKLLFSRDRSKLKMQGLKDELDKCRQLGFAQDIREIDPSFSAVAAPVFGANKKVIGSLFTVGTFADSLVSKYGARVAEIGRKVSYSLGADVHKIIEKIGEEGFID